MWMRQLSPGTTLCGPALALRTPQGVATSTATEVPETDIATKTFPDGSMLIKDGPRTYGSHYGSGQCGGCPRVAFDILYFDPHKNSLTTVFRQGGIIDMPQYQIDFTISDDWRNVDTYSTQPGDYDKSGDQIITWNRSRRCWNASSHIYDQCGDTKNVQPPDPPHFKVSGY